jgi:hypothetical protein
VTTLKLHEFIQSNKLTINPEDIVFKEKSSSLVDANNHRIETW